MTTTTEYVHSLAMRMNARILQSKQQCEMFLYLAHFGNQTRQREYLLKAHEHYGAMQEVTEIHKDLVEAHTKMCNDTR